MQGTPVPLLNGQFCLARTDYVRMSSTQSGLQSLFQIIDMWMECIKTKARPKVFQSWIRKRNQQCEATLRQFRGTRSMYDMILNAAYEVIKEDIDAAHKEAPMISVCRWKKQ